MDTEIENARKNYDAHQVSHLLMVNTNLGIDPS